MNRWWITRRDELPAWMYDRLPSPVSTGGLPVAWESPGGPGGEGGGEGGSGGAGGSGGGGGGGGGGGDDEDPAKLKAKIAQLQQDLRTTKQTASRVTQLEQQLSELSDKDKTDLDRANERVVALEAKVTEEKTKRERALIRGAVERTAREMNFIDEDVAFALMDRSGVVVKDDDTVEGVKEALTVLLSAKPHLKKAEGDAGGAGSGKAPPPPPRKDGQKDPPESPVTSYMDQRYGSKPPAIAGVRNGSS